MTARGIIAGLIAVGSLVGCQTAKPLPPPAPPPPAGPYVLEPGDTLAVRFTRNPDLNDDVVIRPDGMISLQLIDEVHAAGMTASALSAELGQRYASQLAHAEVTVIVKTFTKQRVTVAGEVTTPGAQPLTDGLTLSQAIHQAGGFLKSANRSQVIVIRRQPDGQAEGHSVDLSHVEAGDRPQDDVALQPLDQVFVPRSQIANVNVWVEQWIRNNLPINSLGLGLTAF
jgi:protein involved in polysaccharide export with SLBB domain